MKDNNPISFDPFATFAKDAGNCKGSEPTAKKKRPTSALRPKLQAEKPQMTNLIEFAAEPEADRENN